MTLLEASRQSERRKIARGSEAKKNAPPASNHNRPRNTPRSTVKGTTATSAFTLASGCGRAEAIDSEVAASAGAACHSDAVQISDVLKAMAVPLDWAMGTLRLTTGRMTTAEEIDTAARVICAAVRKMDAAKI